jgi:hypothetical protein
VLAVGIILVSGLAFSPPRQPSTPPENLGSGALSETLFSGGRSISFFDTVTLSLSPVQGKIEMSTPTPTTVFVFVGIPGMNLSSFMKVSSVTIEIHDARLANSSPPANTAIIPFNVSLDGAGDWKGISNVTDIAYLKQGPVIVSLNYTGTISDGTQEVHGGQVTISSLNIFAPSSYLGVLKQWDEPIAIWILGVVAISAIYIVRRWPEHTQGREAVSVSND